MIESGLSLVSRLGVLTYFVTAALAFAVATGPWRRRLTELSRRNWWLVAGLFLLLAAWRIGEGEIWIQDRLREWSRARGFYGERRDLQMPLTLAGVLAALAAVAWKWRHGLGARSEIAKLAALALTGFSIIRAISLHAIDALLYQPGPVHINYLVDGGLTALCAVLALREIAALRRMRHRRGTSKRQPGPTQ